MKSKSVVLFVATALLAWGGLIVRLPCFAQSQAVVANPGTNSILRVAGLQIVDGHGQPVRLRGVSLGGWLDWEGWMFGQGFLSESDILKKLRTLAGDDAAQAFRLGVYSNYIADADFLKIAQLGFNSVRIPVNYRLLDSGTNKSIYHEGGWQILDHALGLCDQYHLYAVLDLHAAPGAQSDWFMADRGDAKKSLWDSAENQRQTVAIWQAIAARYKDRSCVAGYDLINEPDPSWSSQWCQLCRQLITAVRTEDKQHILFIEGSRLATDFSMFSAPPDTNMAYSFHIYTWFGDNRRRKLADYQKFARQQNVPFWVGEFGENHYDMIGTTVKMFDDTSEICGWAFWPWKRAPSVSPGLVTVTVPPEWKAVMAWMNHPLLNHKPSAEETRKAMAAFLEAVKLENTELDREMLRELLPSRAAE